MQDEGYGCIFSIIMAIYNCAPFLRETLDSILDQERFPQAEGGEPLTLEEICEVIMVDDGSTDSSGKICDEYAEKHTNFKVIHKKNGGVASARNTGLSLVNGKYMNFLDGDDCFSKNVLCEVYKFFEKSYEACDVVTIPLRFFDAASGEHWQNYKFKKYSRVANLYNDYDCPLMFVNASFFKSEYRHSVKFCDKLVCGEDIRYICEILSDKMTLGLVSRCHYLYRRRSAGEESLIQASKKKLGWYFDYFEHLTEWTVNFCIKKWGYTPYYYQNILVCDLQWRFNSDYEATALALLGKQGYERYKERLFSVLKLFDDRIILRQRSLWKEHKCMMLSKKYGALPERCVYPDDVMLRFGNTHFCWLSSVFTEYEFISIKGGVLSLEGNTAIIGYPKETKYEVFLKKSYPSAPSVLIPCEFPMRDTGKFRLGERLFTGIGFKFLLPLKDEDEFTLETVVIADGEKIIKKSLRFGKFSPIGNELTNSHYRAEGYTVTTSSNYIKVKRYSLFELVKQRHAFYRELMSSSQNSDRKAAIALRLLPFLKLFKRKPLCLISDRTNKAGDNGEALFGFLCEKKARDIDYLFVIEKDSSDYRRLKSLYGRVLDRSSKSFKLAFLLADCIISSHADDITTNPFSGHFAPYRSILCEKKYVFLQHGITKDNAKDWLNRYSKNIDGLVCAAKPEADAFEAEEYHYSPENVWRTGFPRFDRLYNAKKRYITVMPTWRMYLSVWDKAHEGMWKSSNAFLSSAYFKFYSRLLTDEHLISFATAHGYKLCFMPHPNVFPSIGVFPKHRDVIFFTPDKEYREVFAQSSMILTDYSSVAFDFAYLRKPVIYSQFDKSDFFSGKHAYTKGYFDYERNGFGEVAYDYESTVNLLTEYMSNECRMKETYRKRVDNFFLFSDKNNSRRVYEKIVGLLR